MELKVCGSCGLEKSLDNYCKNGNSLRSDCKECRQINKNRWKKNNHEKVRETNRKYIKQWRISNPEKHKEHNRKIRHNYRQTIKGKIECALRTRLYKTVSQKGFFKSATTIELLGCSSNEFRDYLEKQFVNGMTWDNYGEWHIDHIIPCASFNLLLEEEQRKCFHYTNLQPLWKEDNLLKSDSLNWEKDLNKYQPIGKDRGMGEGKPFLNFEDLFE